ncbi:hypothetical protein [Conservatibacter flavescens]|uniref:Lipoprotein n=1 Tax=Conservatibacter flavescens TaxID=28161 RepID=A0A2M8RZR4_9PAST|nr:hypothetical protein [Conservatibacter flavescens]PJG84356.1 hypothetical protein CVP05_11820 [Conservatibacter flavescens]
MLKFITLIFTLFLTACVNLPRVVQLPEQAQSVRVFKVENGGQRSLLTVQFTPNQWRWVQSDPLGAPIARVILTQQGWENDGFVMPNRQARLLFSALAVALNSEMPPFELNGDWKIRQNAPHFEIALPDNSVWFVEEL